MLKKKSGLNVTIILNCDLLVMKVENEEEKVNISEFYLTSFLTDPHSLIFVVIFKYNMPISARREMPVETAIFFTNLMYIGLIPLYARPCTIFGWERELSSTYTDIEFQESCTFLKCCIFCMQALNRFINARHFSQLDLLGALNVFSLILPIFI